MRPFLLIACLLVVCQSCSKQTQQDPFCILPGLTEMTRIQTQCADAWGYGETNEETVEKLRSYLVQQNITATTITWQPTGEAVACLACTCSRGYSIHVWVEDQYINKLGKEGFTKKY